MIPHPIVEQLGRVKRRQRIVRFAWGASRTLALAAGAMALACLVDWLVDLRVETPPALRTGMLLLQVGLWIGAAAVLVVRPLLRQEGLRELALWAEAHHPELGHRLITTVELNREGARVAGMSAELIAAVKRETEEMSARTDFSSRVDWKPLQKGLAIAGGIAAGVALFVLAAPLTTRALLARQFLADREIPRSLTLASRSPRQVRPSGEELKLRFVVWSRKEIEGLRGTVRVEPADRPSEDYPLVFESRGSGGESVFAATVPPASVDFSYRAWLRDGRTRRSSEVRFVPRPVVQKIDAWVLLPKYCGLRPDGQPYEQYRLRGEIAGPAASSARVEIGVQKPVVKAKMEFLGRPGGETSPEAVLREVELALRKGGLEAEGRFDLTPGETAYRVIVVDEHGFANTSPPKRGIGIVPEEPPRVVLLPERFALPGETGLAEDAEVEGMPIPMGSAIRIAYYAAHPYGLERARLAWRILKAGQESEEKAVSSEVPWQYLPLGEVRATEKSGPFDLRRGVFENTGFRDQVEFHPMPSADPDRVIGRTEGGGCFDFQTKPLVGVQVGDQIELMVEVFARNPALDKSPGRSEARLKAFVTQSQFVDWVLQTLRHESRVRQLESRQRGVFTPEGVDR